MASIAAWHERVAVRHGQTKQRTQHWCEKVSPSTHTRSTRYTNTTGAILKRREKNVDTKEKKSEKQRSSLGYPFCHGCML